MMYRMEILAPSGLYEGWARDHEEMKAKFQAEHTEECFTFLYGDAPINMSFSQYQQAVERGLGRIQMMLLDAYCGDLNNDISAAYDPYQGDS